MSDIISDFGDPRQYVKYIENGIPYYSQVGVEEISTRGRFGETGTSYTSNDISIGNKTFYLDDPRSDIRVGDDVLITCLTNTSFFMWGEVSNRVEDDDDVYLNIFVDDVSKLTEENLINWEIQVVARPKPGIEKDVSTSSNNPTTGGPWTFTVTEGKFFPIGGTLLIKPTTDRSIAVIGEVKAYSGTSLVVSLRETNATVSQSYDSWSIALLDSPPADLPLRLINGLLTTPSSSGMTISPGSVMDSTGEVLLSLTSPLTKLWTSDWTAGNNTGGVVRVELPGTISVSGTACTGSGTSFTTDVTSLGLSDWSTQRNSAVFPLVHISRGSASSSVLSVSDNTSCTLFGGNMDSLSDVNYQRGAIPHSNFSGFLYLCLIRKDSDGSLDACYSSATPTGEPDIPAGYTYYRVLALLNFVGTTLNDFEQALYGYGNQPFVNKFSSLQTILMNNTSSNGNASYKSAVSIDTKTVPHTNDFVLLWDYFTGYGIKKAGVSGLVVPETITGKTEKTSFADDDLILIADSEASFALKKVTKANLGITGGGGDFPTDMGLITESVSMSYDLGLITE